ncbi:MAG: choice-of-anchor D domain-containing protein, partial [Kiritimatiellae bacterium]|nr:choice-of-anchor D domain-containing protein [Kiritimatiellia bacterium]
GHGTPGAHDATLTWTAGAGATGYSVDVWHYEGGSGGGEAATDEITIGLTGVTSTSYTDFEESCEGGSAAVYAGHLAKSDSSHGSCIQMNSSQSSGIWTTTSGGVLKSVTVDWYDANGNGYAIWGKTSGTFDGLDTTGAASIGTLDGTTLTTGDISESGYVAVLVKATGGASYARKVSFDWEGGSSGTKMDDVIANATAPGATAECTVSGTGATLTHLTDGTTYYWTVKSLGEGGCAGGTSSQDSFTTAELLGVPVISTPLASDVEELSGRVTGTAGATLVLKRYGSEEAALAGTAAGLDGVDVSSKAAETGAGTGVWDFTDDGLDGCTTYYYRAWQTATVDGEPATSGGSNVASGKTELGTPVVSAVGAGNQMTISWLPVPGAVSYKVMLTDTENTWTTTGGGSGTTKLSMDFEGITDSHDTELKSSNLAANGLTGWTASKVWTVVEAGEGDATLKYVKLGSGSAGGSLATPQIAAMSSGGKASFDLKTFTGSNGKSDSATVSVDIKYTGDSDWTTLQTFTPGTDWQNYQASITGTKAFQLRLSSSAGNNRFHIDNLVVTENGSGGGGSGKVGLKYEATVTSAPFERTVDGLTIGETYWYKVIATGAEDCETPSEVGSGMPADAPLIEVTPKHYNFGTVNKNEGGATATFTVRNAGSIALKFNAVTLVQDGTAYSITSPTGSELTADLAAGESRTYTVKFNPQTAGTRTATLRFGNDAYNVTRVVPVEGSETYGNLDIPLSGTCHDPATADPEVLALTVRDGLAVDNTVWDESMAHETLQPTLAVTAYHYNGMDEATARWSLYDEEGTAVLTDQRFTAMTPVTHDARSCSLFTAVIPDIPAAKTYVGTYTVGVTLKEATKTYTVTTTNCTPVETGWPFDDFTRADAVATGSGALGNGWTAMASGGAATGEAAIHADALELYGANGAFTGEAGRIAVARDMSDAGYATNPHEFAGTGSWGFHFKTGAKTVGFGNGSTAGAFVLGRTAATWLTDTAGQAGYAVAMADDAVRLVKFEGSLLAGGTITQLGEGQFAGAQGKLLAVRVDFLPGQDEVDADEADDGVHHDGVPAKFRLYVKEVAATGGNPIEECTAADRVLEYSLPGTENRDLKFAGMMWNHGVAQASDKTGAMFDDIYLPHMEGQTEPMMFHVIDEDTEGPEFYGISLRGAVAAPDVAASGLTVTGMVHDASG